MREHGFRPSAAANRAMLHGSVTWLLVTPFFAGPALFCLGAWIMLAVGRRWLGLGVSVGMGGAAMAAGLWSIEQSRASTAAIGILFLPIVGAMSAAAAAVFGWLRTDERPRARAVGWIALAASVAVVGVVIVGGFQTMASNASRDREQQERLRTIDANRATIAALLRAHPGSEEAALAAEIDRHGDDSAFLVPALETAFVREETLDALARRGDLGVTQVVARNARTRPDTLEWIYRRSSYPPLFFLSLAQNPHTPEPVLRELAAREHENGGIAPSLLRNPSTPSDIADALRSRLVR